MLLFSNWKGLIPIETAWGTAVVEGKGLHQGHADVLDYIRSCHKVAGPSDDNSGRYILKALLTDYFKMKGIKPDTKAFHALVKTLKNTSFDIKTTNGKYSFNILDFCGYTENVGEWNEAQVKIDIREEKTGQFQKGAKKGLRPPKGALYVVRFTKEFMDLMSSEIQADYTDLLPLILSLTDIPKRAARFFLCHEKFRKYGTAALAEYLWFKHSDESYQTRKHREDSLRENAKMLNTLFGIKHDPVADIWSYIKHPSVRFDYPVAKKESKSISSTRTPSEIISHDDDAPK